MGTGRGVLSRIIFVNRYFAPDVSATSQILSDLAFHLAGRGHDVHVICGDRLYAKGSKRLPKKATIAGVSVHRVRGGFFGRAGLIGRVADYVGLYAALLWRLSKLLRPGDVLVVKTDPPLLTAALAGLARRRRARFIPWLQDLYPEVAGALGVPLIDGRIGKRLVPLRDRSLEAAEAIVAIGERMKDRLVRQGLLGRRIRVIPNWCDDAEIRPVPPNLNTLRERWGLTGEFVVGYSGNLGRAHEFETLLRAAEWLRQYDELVFLFIGGGHHVEALKSEARRLSLESKFRFQPYQERHLLAQSLSVPDVHWLSLRPALEGLIVPSKFYGIAAAGRPVLNVGSPYGEIAELVRTYRCGLTIEPGDGGGLAGAIEQLMRSPQEASAMGARGRQMIDEHFSKARALVSWEELLA